METITKAEALIWVVLTISALAFLFAMALMLEGHLYQWHRCDWCNHWFNLRGHRQDTRPDNVEQRCPGGLCSHCVASEKANVQRKNLIRKSEFYPRTDFEGN